MTRSIGLIVRSMFRRANNSYPSHAICPVCGFCDGQKLDQDLAARKHARRTASATLGTLLDAHGFEQSIDSILAKRIKYHWIAATYVRNGSADHSSQRGSTSAEI